MYMDQELFDRLFEQHAAGTLDENDRGRLLAMLSDPAYQEALDRNLHALYQSNQDLENANPLMGKHIQAAVLQQVQPSISTRRPSPRITRMVRYVAAAALVAAMAFGGLWYWKMGQKNNGRSQLTKGKKAIVPGSNKAVLTLANGQQIVLDSAANGVLAQQPGAQISKQNGQLKYESFVTANSQLPTFNTLSTPRGGRYQLQLPDGTQVWLNAASSIQYPTAFTGKERQVTVTGEAYFEVTQNAKQPFVVNSDNQQVQVLGTSFNINAYSDEADTRTTLLDGSIRITNPISSHPTSAILMPGEQSVLLATGNLNITLANTQEVMAWRNGQISLTSVSVAVVMRQISRWYDVDVVYEGKVPGNRKFNGFIDCTVPLASLLEALESSNIHTKLEGRTITVMP
jgi:ferric-dicitrate binding protein FerR (iron transport regulator)